MRRRGIAVASLALAIAAKGHPLTITIGTSHEFEVGYGSRHEHVSVRVADASTGSQLDVDRLVFAMAHPTMLRRFNRALYGGNRWNSSKASNKSPTDEQYDLYIGDFNEAMRWSDDGEAWVMAEYKRQTESK